MYNPQDLNLLHCLLHKHRLSAFDLEVAVKTKFKHIKAQEMHQMHVYLREITGEIEDYFASVVDPMRLDNIPETELKTWLLDNYTWMDAKTLDTAYKNGLYYAVK